MPREIKFRTPVSCQNGHRTLWYWEIKMGDFAEIENLGVPQHKKCECPKFEYMQGYGRSGKDQQYTGLHDKNGKEIYEGDIVQTYDGKGNKEYVQEIKWEEYASCCECSTDHGFNTGSLYYYFDGKTPTGTSEVIGNIYENPELLK